MPDKLKTPNPDGRYGAYMKRIFDNPMVERFQKRKTRRSLVMAMLGWYIAINLVAFNFPYLVWVWGLMFLGFFPLMSMLNMSVRGITEIPLKSLDERQGQLKSKAYLQAYIVGVVAAGLLGYAIAQIGTDGFHAVPMFAGGMGIIVGLPTMLLAWNLPDELDEEG